MGTNSAFKVASLRPGSFGQYGISKSRSIKEYGVTEDRCVAHCGVTWGSTQRGLKAPCLEKPFPLGSWAQRRLFLQGANSSPDVEFLMLHWLHFKFMQPKHSLPDGESLWDFT